MPNRQFVQISTAYPNPSVPFREDQKILQQAMEDDDNRDADTYLCLVWSQDNLDEVFQPETWAKSNPLLDLESERENLMKGLMDKRDSDLLSGNLAESEYPEILARMIEAYDEWTRRCMVVPYPGQKK